MAGAVTRIALPAANGVAGRRDHFMVCDTDGFAAVARTCPGQRDRSWMGGMDWDEACRAAHDGHPEGVRASEAFLSEFSDMDFNSRRWLTIDSVAGGAPNLGAYLAGSPVSMRRRQKIATETAPLTILCDMVSSGGIDAHQLKMRGAAVLALVRMLTAVRPVVVYGVGGLSALQNTGESAFAMIRMDDPLDLSRAAFFLAHPAAQRGLLYQAIHHKVAALPCGGSWPYGNVDKYREHGAKLYAAAVGADPADCLFLPPVFMKDELLTQPVKWLRDMLARYGGTPTHA